MSDPDPETRVVQVMENQPCSHYIGNIINDNVSYETAEFSENFPEWRVNGNNLQIFIESKGDWVTPIKITAKESGSFRISDYEFYFCEE